MPILAKQSEGMPLGKNLSLKVLYTFLPSTIYSESLFNKFKSIKPDKDDDSILKLLSGKTVRENVIIATGGGEACLRKFDN
jgi:hypothetical protein